MSYGKLEYNELGLPKCEICGNFFHRVASHARQKHNISAFDYKNLFGLNNNQGICSKESALKTRIKTIANFNTVIVSNLLKNGANTRFKKGYKGRTRDVVREQTRISLKKHINLINLKNEK